MHLLNMPEQRAFLPVHCVTKLTRKRLQLAYAVRLCPMKPQILGRCVLLTTQRTLEFGDSNTIRRVHSVVVSADG